VHVHRGDCLLLPETKGSVRGVLICAAMKVVVSSEKTERGKWSLRLRAKCCCMNARFDMSAPYKRSYSDWMKFLVGERKERFYSDVHDGSILWRGDKLVFYSSHGDSRFALPASLCVSALKREFDRLYEDDKSNFSPNPSYLVVEALGRAHVYLWGSFPSLKSAKIYLALKPGPAEAVEIWPSQLARKYGVGV
jgi:hypothetical protein